MTVLAVLLAACAGVTPPNPQGFPQGLQGEGYPLTATAAYLEGQNIVAQMNVAASSTASANTAALAATSSSLSALTTATPLAATAAAVSRQAEAEATAAFLQQKIGRAHV